MVNKKRAGLMDEVMTSTWQLKRLMHSRVMRARTESDLSPSQTHLLMMLAQREITTVKQLAQEMSLTPGAITQLVDPLLQRGLLERTPDKNDRRVWHLCLTAASKTHVRDWHRRSKGIFTAMLDGLDDQELSDYLAIQRKLITHLEHTNQRKEPADAKSA